MDVCFWPAALDNSTELPDWSNPETWMTNTLSDSPGDTLFSFAELKESKRVKDGFFFFFFNNGKHINAITYKKQLIEKGTLFYFLWLWLYWLLFSSTDDVQLRWCQKMQL